MEIKNNKHNKFALKFVGLVLAIFTLVTAFSSILNVMSYQKLTTKVYSDASKLSVTGTVNTIQYSVSFDKPIGQFYGMNELLDTALSVSDDILTVGVVSNDSNVLYATDSNFSSVPSDLFSKDYIETADGIYTSCPINDDAFLVLLLDKSFVDSNVNSYIASIVQIDLVVMAGVALLTLLIYFLLSTKKQGISFKSLKLSGIIILVLAQLALGIFVITTFTNEYKSSVNKISAGVSQTVKSDLEKIVNQGIKMEELDGLDDYFSTLIQDIPEIDNISLTNHKIGDSSTMKIMAQEQVYYINVTSHVDDVTIRNKIIEVAIDASVLIVITILISLELSLFIGSFINSEKKKRKVKDMSLPGIRMFLFIIQMALGLDAGFISIVSYNLFKSSNNPSLSYTVAGLPVTIGIIASALGILLWGKLINKVGLKTSIITGTICSAGGLFLSAVAGNLVLFSIARFIYGFGIAAILVATRICISNQSTVAKRTEFSSIVSVGMLAGSSCGVVIGGLLADRTSYSFVFMLAGIVSIIALLLFPITNINNSKNTSSFSFSQAKKIMRSPTSVFYILLIIIPIYIASMFIGYSIPLFGNEISISQTIISAMIMMNYIATAYLTNHVSNYTMKLLSTKKLIFIYEIMIIVSILLFCLFNNLFVAILAVILLAVADSFGLIVIVEALYEQNITGLDRSTIAILLIFISKIGSGLAPTLISSGITGGVAKATLILPLIVGVGLLTYAIINKILINKKSLQ